MSDARSPNGRQEDTLVEGGILAGLPRKRPQRASARRAATDAAKHPNARPTRPAKPTNARTAKPSRARSAKPAGAKRAATAKPTSTASRTAAKRPASPASRARTAGARPPEPPAPKQGYEPEEEVELGATVHPPSGLELAESVADIFSELAGTGLAAGGRLLKDAFSLLRRP
jgi:hypothetical protein